VFVLLEAVGLADWPARSARSANAGATSKRVRAAPRRASTSPASAPDPRPGRAPRTRLREVEKSADLRPVVTGSKRTTVRAYCGGPLESAECRRESVSPYWFAPAPPLDSQLQDARPNQGRSQPTSITAGSWVINLYPCASPAVYCSNNNGNILEEDMTTPGVSGLKQTFTYDALNRLATATEKNSGGTTTWSETYGYDIYGNRWVSATTPTGLETAFTPTASSNFNSSNRLLNNGALYDLSGNQTTIGGFTNTFDAENRLASSTLNSITSTYAYDGGGQRVQKAVAGGATTTYVYDANRELAAEYVSGTPPTPLCVTCFLAQDTLGSTRIMFDAGTGSPVAMHDYLPFGEELVNVRPGTLYGGTDNPTQKFTGKERDAESGLDYFGARYFSGAQGRFTSSDPVFVTAHRVSDPQQWNLYAYSRNNPLRFTDPTGLDIWLQGCGDESDTCHKGYVGSYNDNGKFDRTHLSGDLTDSASLGTTGVNVNYNGGTYQGVWDTNKNEQNAVTVGGSGALSDLSFTVNGNCGGPCQASGFVNGTNTASGLQALQFAVTSPGSGFLKNPGFYGADPFHAGRTNFLGYDPNQPQGLAATHLPVPPSLLIGPNGQPTNVDFHVDQRYPFEDVTGFANHVGSIGHTLLNDVRSIFTGLVDHGNH